MSWAPFGERLFISQKTVGVHVGNILAKLGVWAAWRQRWSPSAWSSSRPVEADKRRDLEEESRSRSLCAGPVGRDDRTRREV